MSTASGLIIRNGSTTMLDFKVGDRVVFNKARFAGGAVYGRSGEIINRKEPEDFTEYGVVCEISEVAASRYTPAYTVIHIKVPAYRGNRIERFHECQIGEGYWIRHAYRQHPIDSQSVK